MPKPEQLSLLISRLPAGADFVTVKELAAASGFSPNFILAAYDTGKIFGIQANGRARKGSENRLHTRIPIEAAKLWLLSVANFTDDDAIEIFFDVIDRFPRDLLRRILPHIQKRIAS